MQNKRKLYIGYHMSCCELCRLFFYKSHGWITDTSLTGLPMGPLSANKWYEVKMWTQTQSINTECTVLSILHVLVHKYHTIRQSLWIWQTICKPLWADTIIYKYIILLTYNLPANIKTLMKENSRNRRDLQNNSIQTMHIRCATDLDVVKDAL